MTTAVKPFYEVVDDHLFINMHLGQRKVWEATTRTVCLLCGAQYGKTSIGPCWLNREMDSRGSGDYLAATANFPLLEKTMLPVMETYFDQLLGWGKYKVSSRMFESHERERGGPAQRIIIGSANNSESLESATVKAAWLDECGQHSFSRGSYEAVQRRLAVNEGRLLLTTTPYEFNWFKSEIYDRWRQGDPNITVIQGKSTDNPAFPKEEFERQRSLMPLWKFRMMYEGAFEKPAGLIYDAFDDTVCLIPRFVLPESWPRYVGHDFGPNNTAAVWYAQDPGTGFLYVYRDYHAGGLSAHDHAEIFKRMSAGENIIKRVGGSNSEDGWREAFTVAGWPISKPREREVEVGINTVYGYHQQNKLFVFNDVTGYLDEKQSYSRKLDEDYEPTILIDDKAKFHRMDAERYIISDLGPERAHGFNEKAQVIYHNGQDGPTSDKRKRKMSQNPQRKFWRELERV